MMPTKHLSLPMNHLPLSFQHVTIKAAELLSARFDVQQHLMKDFLNSFKVEPIVTEEMVEVALEEHKRLLDNPLLILPRLGIGQTTWDKAVMRKILEAAERIRLEKENEDENSRKRYNYKNEYKSSNSEKNDS